MDLESGSDSDLDLVRLCDLDQALLEHEHVRVPPSISAPGLEDSFEPYAKSDVAQMIAGVTPSGVVAYAVTDTGVMTGSTFVVDTNVDAPSLR